MKTRCVVVIGHVDHGKTSLVRALTGMNTDRLPEEKLRGLSIAPGFAHRSYPGGVIDFIDAPGHADFVQAMICAAAGATAALIVISAAEGVQPQTIEHLAVAGLLGITQAVIAVTKSDEITQTELSERLTQIKTALTSTQFAMAPMIACSAETGAGLDALHAALAGLTEHAPVRAVPPHSFLAIDRVFTRPGRGTVVTGTLLGDDLALADDVTLYPRHQSVTLRGLQSRGLDKPVVQAGARMAANLRGVDANAISRGDVLAASGEFHATNCVDVSLHMLDGKRIKHMQEVRLHVGTCSVVAQVRKLRGASDLKYAQLRLRQPICAFDGQRAVLRQLSPALTLGGALFLDVRAPVGVANRGDVLRACETREPSEIATALITAQNGIATLSDVARLAGTLKDAGKHQLGPAFDWIDSDTVTSKTALNTLETDLLKTLAEGHHAQPLRPSVPHTQLWHQKVPIALREVVERRLVAAGDIRVDEKGVALAGHDPVSNLTAPQQVRMQELEDIFKHAALAPLPLTPFWEHDLDNDLLTLLIENGTLTRLENVSLKQTLILHGHAIRSARLNLQTAFPAAQDFTTGEARTALHTTRKVIVPLLEYFDVIGVTQRSGDHRQVTA